MSCKAGLLLLAGMFVRGQTTPLHASFDAVAIKRATSARGSGAGISGNIYTAANLSLVQLIAAAYQVRDFQISGAAPWMKSERFTITATAPGDPAEAQARHLEMLQALLADRFHLKIHHETKTVTAYALMVDAGGPKIKESVPGETTKETSGPGVGGLPAGGSGGGYAYTAASMAYFANRLTYYFRRYAGGMLVLDMTGLKGSYDFALPWTPQTAPGGEGPSIFTAIKQLGLRLDKVKYPVETIVIDSAGKPTID